MLENPLFQRPERHPVTNLIIILALVGLGFVLIGPVIGFFLALPFYPGSMMDMIEAFQNPLNNPDLKVPLYIMQGFATLIGLIVIPTLYLANERKPVSLFFTGKKIEITPVVIVVVLVIVFMFVNSVFIEWNSKVQFPDFLRGFEQWAREREDENAELTKYLTAFDTDGEVLIALIVIGILPAIGEELVFRGMIQNEMFRATRNIHISIWVSAILFSAIHMQFFGFVPRMFLGALFGYLYYWSGKLSLAMLAHFVNNGFSVVAMYLYQKGKFNFDPESTEAVPVSVIAIAAICTAGLLYFFHHYFKNRQTSTHQL